MPLLSDVTGIRKADEAILGRLTKIETDLAELPKISEKLDQIIALLTKLVGPEVTGIGAEFDSPTTH